MFKKEQKEKFSFRKYKNGRTDSKLIGATVLAVGIGLSVGANAVQADVVSSNNSSATLVSDTAKVSSASSATFRDDENPSNVVKVDAILDKDVAEPTKANKSVGESDGADVLNLKAEATVNYKLDSDGSVLKSEKVQLGSGTVTTPYDKKGLAYDTDGKNYRESVVEKTGSSLSDATGKEKQIKANGKTYEYVRSELEGTNSFNYDKTKFNNIEAAVSPEGLQNKAGEVDYTKLTGKVYIVEETADGQYGKYVVADSVANQDVAVATWKNGLSTAKDFTKENVTLKSGDSILVLDKDTYAVGSNAKKHIKKIEINRIETEPIPPDTGYATVKGERLLSDGTIINYAIGTVSSDGIISSGTKFKDSSSDYELGTGDDTEELLEDGAFLKFDTNDKIKIKTIPLRNVNKISQTFNVHPVDSETHLTPEKSTLSDHLRDINSLYLDIANMFEKSTFGSNDYRRNLRKEAGKVSTYIEETANFVRNNGIKFGLVNKELVFYHQDKSKLDELRDKIKNTRNVLNGLSSKLEGSIHDKTLDPEANVSYEGELTYDSSNPLLLTGNLNFSYQRYFGGSAGEKVTETIVYDDDIEVDNYWTNGKVTISKDKKSIVLSDSSTKEANTERTETTSSITYTPKEVLSVVRAYKVVAEGTATVNHYYVETPEFTGGVVPLAPPVVEIPEFNGGVNPIKPPVLEVPELDIPVIPMEEMSDPRPVEKPKPKPKPKEDVTIIPADFSKVEESRVKEELKPVAETPRLEPKQEVVAPQEEKAMLPNTGTKDSSSLTWLGLIGLSAVLGISKLKKTRL